MSRKVGKAPWNAIGWAGGGVPSRSADCGRCIRRCPRSGSARYCGWRCPTADWERFEALADACAPIAPTQARAHGLVISGLLNAASAPRPEPGPTDWMDWERRKTLRLLLKKSS